MDRVLGPIGFTGSETLRQMIFIPGCYWSDQSCAYCYTGLTNALEK